MEIWRTIRGYENYEISNYGNVRSKDRVSKRNGYDAHLKGQQLKMSISRGYYKVTLYGGNRENHKQIFVHRLVAEQFIDNPDGFPYINHKDENKLNNHVDNLEWCTAKYNSNYGTAIERRVKHQDWDSISKKHMRPVCRYDKNGNLLERYESTIAPEKDGFKGSSVCRCCGGYLKTYKGYIWKYAE